VTSACPCPDAQRQAPEGLCVHTLAALIYWRALRQCAAERATQEAPRAAQTAMATTARAAGRPEALLSITLEGTMRGRKVWLTARGRGWEEFQAHVERLRGLLDAGPAGTAQIPSAPSAASQPAGPAPTVETPVCPYHGVMQERSPTKRT
jgi:hypothetical protein